MRESTVRFLVASSGTWTTEFLGLRTTVISNKECSVVLDESLLQLILGVLVDEFLIIGNDGLSNRLTDGVDLRCVTTTRNTDADVDTGEFVEADNQERLVHLNHNGMQLDKIPIYSIKYVQYRRYACRTLKRRISGWMRLRGWPLTLMRPFPCCSKFSAHFLDTPRHMSLYLNRPLQDSP